MGKRGPAPAPTALKLVRGDRKSRIATSEPQPDDVEVKPPLGLTPKALTVWRRVAPQLVRQRLVTSWDVDAFAAYCEAVVTHVDATKAVRKHGVLITSDHGGLVKNPALQVARDAANTIRALAREFGLTPSARASIGSSSAGKAGSDGGPPRAGSGSHILTG